MALPGEMKEADYIAVTDLTRLRIAQDLIRGCLPETKTENAHQRVVNRQLFDWITVLDKRVEKINITE